MADDRGPTKKLRMANVEACHGSLGTVRDDNVLFPKEELYLRFTVEGTVVGEDGNVNVDMTVTLRDATGEELLSVSSNLVARVALGGNVFPGQARVQLPPSCIPGDFVLSVKITDNFTGQTDSYVYSFVLQGVSDLAIVNPRFYFDDRGTAPVRLAPPGGIVGQTLHYRLSVLGIDSSANAVHGTVSAQVFDQNGVKAMMPRPVEVSVSEDSEEFLKSIEMPVVDFSGHMVLTRAGRFLLAVTFFEHGTGRRVTARYPLLVIPRNQWPPVSQ